MRNDCCVEWKKKINITINTPILQGPLSMCVWSVKLFRVLAANRALYYLPVCGLIMKMVLTLSIIYMQQLHRRMLSVRATYRKKKTNECKYSSLRQCQIDAVAFCSHELSIEYISKYQRMQIQFASATSYQHRWYIEFDATLVWRCVSNKQTSLCTLQLRFVRVSLL